MDKLLALDLSTTVMGYAVFDMGTSNLEHIGYYQFAHPELLQRGKELELLVKQIVSNFGITHVGIEENLKSFRAGGTNASAMHNTSKLNFLGQYICRYLHELEVVEINVNTARGLAFPGFHKVARLKKGTKHKEIAFEMVTKVLTDKYWPTKVMKSGPRKGETIVMEEAKDMADAWVIGMAILNRK